MSISKYSSNTSFVKSLFESDDVFVVNPIIGIFAHKFFYNQNSKTTLFDIVCISTNWFAVKSKWVKLYALVNYCQNKLFYINFEIQRKIWKKYKFTNKKPLGYIQYFLLFIGKIFLFIILPLCVIGLIVGAIRGTL